MFVSDDARLSALWSAVHGLTSRACEAMRSEVLNTDRVMRPSKSASNKVSGL
jgi:hypothetical protein